MNFISQITCYLFLKTRFLIPVFLYTLFTFTKLPAFIFVARMEAIINKVAQSGLITLNLEDFLPKQFMVFDMKDFLFMGLILKEKEFRQQLQNHDWNFYQQKEVVITCSADAIIPVWAYMLVSSFLEGVATGIVINSEEKGREAFLLKHIDQMDVMPFQDQRVVIKGCGDQPIPESAYALITFKLKPVVKSIMYGEPCSTVPVYKKKSI